MASNSPLTQPLSQQEVLGLCYQFNPHFVCGLFQIVGNRSLFWSVSAYVLSHSLRRSTRTSLRCFRRTNTRFGSIPMVRPISTVTSGLVIDKNCCMIVFRVDMHYPFKQADLISLYIYLDHQYPSIYPCIKPSLKGGMRDGQAHSRSSRCLY